MRGAEQPDDGHATPQATLRIDGGPGSDPAVPDADGHAAELAHSAPSDPVGPATAGQRPLIAVDAMGGDHAPDEIVAGAVAAAREHGIRIALTGRPGLLRPLLARSGNTASRATGSGAFTGIRYISHYSHIKRPG